MQATIAVEHVSGFRLDWGRIPHALFVKKGSHINDLGSNNLRCLRLGQ